jgi:DMSO/TMAO reductase YedYZ molybdopterin-dependent catalytic subunit
MNISRRRLLAIAAASAVPLRPAATAAAVHKRDMIVRSTRPEDLEMPLDGFRELITPAERFFVRSHHYVPTVDLLSWRLQLDGAVRTPLSIGFAEIERMPRVELAGVLECAGNGRGLFEPAVPGIQWEYGAAGNARWTGVRLRDLLQSTGVSGSGQHLLFSGADAPPGTMPKFERTITVEKALDANTLLAYEMNGRALPVQHGFPLRLIVPGWAGNSWVKWVTHIRVLDRDFDGFFMKTAYRHPEQPVPPGTAVDPARMVPITNLAVKSVIHTPLPGAEVRSGAPLRIAGVAWASGSVTTVDVSVDGGKSWSAATLGDAPGEFSWRPWSYTAPAPSPGNYALLARARTASGDEQPAEQPWNPSGYLWNTVQRIEVTAVDREPMTYGFAGDRYTTYPPGYKEACHVCHGEDIVEGQKLTRAQWERELDKMSRWGAQVKPEQRESILEYLTRNFGPRPRK